MASHNGSGERSRNSNGSQNNQQDGNGGRQSDDSRDNRERQPTVIEMIVIVTLVALATGSGTVFHETTTVLEFGVSVPPPSPPPPAPEPEALYYCWCGRQFQTDGELVQHMASHNQGVTVPPPDEGCSSSQSPPKKRRRVEQQHECRICGKSFPSGQALGGHMRAHYEGDLSRPRHAKNNASPDVAPASSAVSVAIGDHSASMSVNNDNNIISSVADNSHDVAPEVEESTVVVGHVDNKAGQASGHRRLDFDLNVKLDEASEEEESDEEAEEEDSHSDGDWRVEEHSV